MDDLKIRLVLEGAEQVQSGANKAADGVRRLGQSSQQAGQQAQLSGQQMAQVSAQLQDLFIQIQGGQAPITALLQQGSQLTTVFGGVGGALRAVGGFAATLVNPFTLAASAVAALGFAYLQGQAEAQAYTRALALTGSAAGVTAGQLQALAAAQAQVFGTQGQAAQALAALASTGQVSAGALGAAAEAATRLAAVGVPLEETVKKFAALGKDPLKALVDLNQAENFLTESIYRQVKALTEQGRVAEAAAIAQNEYARVGKQRSEELLQSLGLLERGWAGLGNVAKKAWDFMLGIGRPETAQAAFGTVSANIQALEQRLARVQSGQEAAPPGYTRDTLAGRLREQIDSQRSLQESLQETMRLEARSLSSRQTAADALRGIIKTDEDAAKASKEAASERARETAAIERAIGLSGTYGQTLSELQQLRQRGLVTEQQYIAAVQRLIQEQPMVREQLQAQAEAQRQAARALDDALKAEQRRLDATYRTAEQLAANVLKLQEEEKAVQLSAAANMSLAEAIERVTIARLEEVKAQATAAGDYGTAAALRAEIDAREKLATMIGRKEAREAAKRSADDAAREWQRAASDIERSLTDALLRGFESGKSFGANLRDTLVNIFKTTVLRPIIQPVVTGTAGTLGGLLGLPSTATAGGLSSSTGGLGALGQLSQLGQFGQLGQLLGFGGSGSLPLGAGGALESAAALNGAYSSAFTQGLASLGPIAALAAAGYFGGKAIANGYSIGGANTGGGIGAALGIGGAALYGPIGAAVGGVLGGVLNRAFGRGAKETQGTGLVGTVSVDGFNGQAFADWLQKGGWFRSDKRGTDYSAVGAEQDSALDMSVKVLYETTAEYARVLGLPVSAVKGYAASFKVAWGATEEENQKAIATAIAGLGEDLAARYAAELSPLRNAGEALSATLQRLAGLQVFSSSINTLGGVFSRVANASVSAREQLIALAGGMDSLGQQALGFAQNYYGREEIAGLKARDVQQALGAAGISADVNTREQFRALVESLDPNTTTGRQQLAALLQLQGSFATLADYLTETGLTLSQAAAQAPVTDALLSPLLSNTGQQLQLAQQSMDAQYETRDATLQVVEAVQQLTAAVTGSGGGWVPSYRQPEVTMAY